MKFVQVHKGMGAAREFLRMSQQDLASMDSAPSAELPSPSPPPPPQRSNPLSSGGALLAMLQGRPLPPSPSRGGAAGEIPANAEGRLLSLNFQGVSSSELDGEWRALEEKTRTLCTDRDTWH